MKNQNNNRSPFNDLVEKAQCGDEASMRNLIDQMHPPIIKFLLFLSGSQQEAEELAQETFIKAYQKLHTLKDPENFQSWLYQTAKNLFMNAQRKKKLFSLFEATKEESVEGPEFSQHETAREVHDTLSRLAESDRLVLVLADIQGLSYAETAQALGIKENAVRSRIYRARQRFEELWSEKMKNRSPA